MIARYWKAIAAGLLGILNWANLVVQSPDGAITRDEWSVLIGVAIATLGVLLVPNAPKPGGT